MKNCVVYSCIAGPIDDLQKEQNWGQADWFIFTDQKFSGGKWNVRSLFYTDSINPRRNARSHKTSPQLLFPEYKYHIWIDGTIQLLVTPEKLVEKYLKYADMAALNHPYRDCIYDEAEICKQMKLDREELIDKQMREYRRQGYPESNGLAETKVVVRRNCPVISDFNEMWTDEIRHNSLRDQLSFDYCVYQLGIKVNLMPRWKNSNEIKYHLHLDKRKK